MTSHNFETLQQAVLGSSESTRWGQAVAEWQVIGVEEEPHGSGICVCGKTGLVYLYTIYNQRTLQTLSPIGSSCVNLFEVEDLNLSVSVLRRLLELRSAFTTGKHVELTSEYFSRAMLADLWEQGAFPPNDFNRSNGDNDYRFLLDLYNRKNDSTEKETRKAWVLLNRTNKNFVMHDKRLA